MTSPLEVSRSWPTLLQYHRWQCPCFKLWASGGPCLMNLWQPIDLRWSCPCEVHFLVSVYDARSGLSIKQNKLLVKHKVLPSHQHLLHQVWRKMFFPNNMTVLLWKLFLIVLLLSPMMVWVKYSVKVLGHYWTLTVFWHMQLPIVLFVILVIIVLWLMLLSLSKML